MNNPKVVTETMPTYPARREETLQKVLDALRQKEWVPLQGVPETEEAIRQFHGNQHTCWFIASGTAALQACMLGYEIGPGDEVIVPGYTWGATVSAVLSLGAIPILVDVDRITGQILPEAVVEAISPKTKAIIGVHFFGFPFPAKELRTIADQHGIVLIEDGSQAHGVEVDGRLAGSWGHASAFSCMGLKLLAGTEGGYCLFEDPKAAEKAFLYGKHPRGLDPEQASRLGQAGLLDSLQLGWRPCMISALLVKEALPFLPQEIGARRENLATLRHHLGEDTAWIIPREKPGDQACWHLPSLVVDDQKCAKPLEEIQNRCREKGVGVFRYLPTPLNRLKRLSPNAYQGPRVFWHESLRDHPFYQKAISLPNAEWRSSRSLEMVFNWTQPNPTAMEQIARGLREAL